MAAILASAGWGDYALNRSYKLEINAIQSRLDGSETGLPFDLGVVKSGRRPMETCIISRLTGPLVLVGRNWRFATFISTLPYSVL